MEIQVLQSLHLSPFGAGFDFVRRLLPSEDQRSGPPQLSWPRLGQPLLGEACLPYQRGLQGSNSRTPIPAMRATLGKPRRLVPYSLFAAPGPGGSAEP